MSIANRQGRVVAQVLADLEKIRIIPVIAMDDAGDALPLAEALRRGGVGTAEITFRTPAAEAAIRAMARHAEMLVGAGTVTTVTQVDDAVAAGAAYVVSPGFSGRLVAHCHQLGVPIFPGVATPSEVQQALEAGLSVVKFFPAATMGGPDMLKAMSVVYPGIRYIPTGGISQDNVASYLVLPCVVAVGGSWIATPRAIAAHAWGAITDLAGRAVAAARMPADQ